MERAATLKTKKIGNNLGGERGRRIPRGED